jgi:hypothetical protein
MREFGFTNPVLIDDENGIIAGHDHVLAGRNMAGVPCIELIASRVGQSAGHARGAAFRRNPCRFRPKSDAGLLRFLQASPLCEGGGTETTQCRA